MLKKNHHANILISNVKFTLSNNNIAEIVENYLKVSPLHDSCKSFFSFK